MILLFLFLLTTTAVPVLNLTKFQASQYRLLESAHEQADGFTFRRRGSTQVRYSFNY